MSFGESTTEAVPGYRKKFCDLAKTDGLSIDMIGPNSDGTGLSYDGDNAGFAGNACSNLINKLFSDCAEYYPDIVLLWEGTNDCGWAYKFYINNHPIIDELSLLVDEICVKYPNALVFVGSIPPLASTSYPPFGAAKTNAEIYNEAMPGMIAAKAASGKKVYFVDARSLSIYTDITADGIHPNQAGYDKVGLLFYNAIKPSFTNSGVSLPETITLAIGATTTLNPICLPARSVQAVTWSSNSPSATVSIKGIVTGVSMGTVIITATSKIYSTNKASCTVTVSEITGLYNIEESEMLVYPNPVTNYQLTINSNNSIIGKISLSLYDMTGNKVYSVDVRYAPVLSISLPQYLIKGLYFLKIKNGMNTVTKSIVIK